MANANAADEATLPDLMELNNLVKRAENGDRTTLPALREVLKNPAVVDALGGDLAQQAALSLIAAASGKKLPVLVRIDVHDRRQLLVHAQRADQGHAL